MIPDWLPDVAVTYLAHTSAGMPIRALARVKGCHASTVLRQVRRVEAWRDDPLVDEALDAFPESTLPNVFVPQYRRKRAPCPSQR